MYHYRARWYDANTGRFISEDPIGLSGGINQFGYVNNNPLNAVDPFGLDARYDRQLWQARQDLIEFFSPAIQFGIGFGDNTLFGLSKYARPSLGVNECSVEYQAGEWTSIAIQVAEGSIGIYRAGG